MTDRAIEIWTEASRVGIPATAATPKAKQLGAADHRNSVRAPKPNSAASQSLRRVVANTGAPRSLAV
jgi:hypothetical protein